MCRLGEDEEAFEAYRLGNLKHTKDALQCATASYEDCAVLTLDKGLRNRAQRRGLSVLSPAEVDGHLADSHASSLANPSS
jgi:hypothetical protein